MLELSGKILNLNLCGNLTSLCMVSEALSSQHWLSTILGSDGILPIKLWLSSLGTEGLLPWTCVALCQRFLFLVVSIHSAQARVGQKCQRVSTPPPKWPSTKINEKLVDTQPSLFASKWVNSETHSAICQSSSAEQSPAAHSSGLLNSVPYMAPLPVSSPTPQLVCSVITSQRNHLH